MTWLSDVTIDDRPADVYFRGSDTEGMDCSPHARPYLSKVKQNLEALHKAGGAKGNAPTFYFNDKGDIKSAYFALCPAGEWSDLRPILILIHII
jgi:hypothetical protein